LRNAFAKALYECALKDERIYILAADISPAGPLVQFAKDFPRRFINVGVAEQAMIGMAAGLALKGLRPFCYTIAPFALYRPFEFIRDDLAYQNLPVTVVGMGAGLSYSSLGGTHQAIEDVSIASSIPNMQVLAPYDPASTAKLVEYCATQNKGPVYLRLGKSGEPNLDLKRRQDRTCILGYGPILGEFQDFSCAPVTMLKPLDGGAIASVLRSYKQVVVIEEHTPWLYQKVLSIAQEWFLDKMPCRIWSFALKDEFIHYFGSRAELLEKHGLTRSKIFDAIGRHG
jgi:transketolase